MQDKTAKNFHLMKIDWEGSSCLRRNIFCFDNAYEVCLGTFLFSKS